jgi:hypothetical protein
MTLKKFLEENTAKGFEVIENQLIINVITENNTYHGINVDTSNIPNGTKLTTKSDFTLKNDVLTVGGVTINVGEVDMLPTFEEIMAQNQTQPEQTK